MEDEKETDSECFLRSSIARLKLRHEHDCLMRNTLLQVCRMLAPMLGTIQPEYEDDGASKRDALSMRSHGTRRESAGLGRWRER